MCYVVLYYFIVYFATHLVAGRKGSVNRAPARPTKSEREGVIKRESAREGVIKRESERVK